MDLLVILQLQKLFLTIKLLIKCERKKIKKIPAHSLEGNYLANHLVKFLQGEIKPWKVGALRVSTASQSF